MADGTRRTMVAAFLANLGIALAKLGAFALTGSAAMLAETVHSVADTGNQALLFLGGKRSRQPPTPEHPFGFGQERYFWAFIVALVLFTLGSLFALFEGVDKLTNPHTIDSPEWAFAVLGVGLVLEGLSLRTARREATPRRAGRSWWGYIRGAKSPEVPVVLLEDTGALLGLLMALAGVTLAEVTGDARWDAAGSLGIGVLLGIIATLLVIEMKSLLIGEAASPLLEDRIRTVFAESPEVERLIHLRTLHLGPDDLLVAAKVELDCATIDGLAHAIDTVEARLRAAVPTARLVYLEPDLYRPGLAAPAQPDTAVAGDGGGNDGR